MARIGIGITSGLVYSSVEFSLKASLFSKSTAATSRPDINNYSFFAPLFLEPKLLLRKVADLQEQRPGTPRAPSRARDLGVE